MCEYCIEAIKDTPSLVTIEKDYFSNPFPIKPTGFVYFFATQDLSRIKIGYTMHNPYDRMKYYQTSELSSLIMVAFYPVIYRKTEKQIHKLLSEIRIDKRREWFFYNGRMCFFLKKLWQRFYCQFGYYDIDNLWGVKLHG
jgi:hypothetical protein